MDSDLKKQLQEIQLDIKDVSNKLGGSWKALARGVLTGFGYVVGAFVALLIIGWVLNIVGVIPSLKNAADKWQTTLQNTQQRPLP